MKRPPWPWERAKQPEDRWLKLRERFGITADRFGFVHVEDPLVAAIRAIQVGVPRAF